MLRRISSFGITEPMSRLEKERRMLNDYITDSANMPAGIVECWFNKADRGEKSHFSLAGR